ncbi:MAG: ABC transporter substrate-binding protein [Betaproteobacteria bacterium]|nr:ABC transporter substrate-binding protein [Betaproteobacteria bacterium]
MITKKLAWFSAVVSGVISYGLVSASAFAQEQVNVRFSWRLKGEYAHMYVAQEKGYFSREGISVRLGEGAGSQAALGALLQGQEDAVLLPGIFAITAISKGMPVKLIALYHPVTPMALISKPEKPVRVPKDLEGKSIATAIGETGTSYLDAFCRKNGVDCGKVNRVQMHAQARVPSFMQGKVDVVSVYQTNDLPILREKEGIKFAVLEMDKFGLAVPGMALVSSDAIIAKKPEALRKLLKAVGDAVVDSRKDPAAAANMMIKHWSGSPSASVVTAQVKATVEAIPVVPGKPIGWIEEKLIADTLELLKSVGEIEAPKSVPVYFTNSLLGM